MPTLFKNQIFPTYTAHKFHKLWKNKKLFLSFVFSWAKWGLRIEIMLEKERNKIYSILMSFLKPVWC